MIRSHVDRIQIELNRIKSLTDNSNDFYNECQMWRRRFLALQRIPDSSKVGSDFLGRFLMVNPKDLLERSPEKCFEELYEISIDENAPRLNTNLTDSCCLLKREE